MREVRLYGPLGERFGREHRYDVRSPGEAVRALCATVPGFRQYLIEHSEPGYKVFAGVSRREFDQLHDPSGSREVIRIVPVIAGAGGRGGLGIILGVALALVAPYVAPALVGVGVSAQIAGAVGTAVGAIGKALVIGGISQLLFSPDKPHEPDARASEERKPSYAFDGPVNPTSQGNAVPLIYGRVLVGGQVLSQSLRTAQVAI